MLRTSLIRRFQPKIIIALYGFLFITFSVQAETIYELDFSVASGDVKKWFETIHWEFREDIAEMNLRFEEGILSGAGAVLSKKQQYNI